MKKTFKYRLLANPQVFQKADYWLELCRNLYNTALEQRVTIYRQNKGSISCYGQIKQLPALKAAFPEYHDVVSVRIHSCPFCGLTIDRDINAALNIYRVGQTLRDSRTKPENPMPLGVGVSI